MKNKIGGLLISLLLLCSCTSFPDKVKEANADDTLLIYPDYKDVIVPCNISPLNFMVDNEAEICAVKLSTHDGAEIRVVSGKDKKVLFPKKEWHDLLSKHTNDSIFVDVYLKNKTWIHYPQFTFKVVSDSIDPYITCRLIEPLYNSTGKICLAQFSTENAELKILADNKRYMQDPSHEGPKCVNCHTKQRNGSGNCLFFCREKGGGLVMTYNGTTKIIDMKAGDMRVGAVFSTWHPNKPYIAFSNNKVMQLFMSNSNARIEPIDYFSDLLMYDIEQNEISYICKTKDVMETNPYWSPDGKYIYYCSSDTVLNQNVFNYKKMKYDLKRIAFNEDSLTWGNPELVFAATKIGKSASKPKVSPNGRYVVFTLSEFSGYHYSHEDTDLYLYDLQTDSCRSLSVVNTNHAEGIADWSSNNKWLLVSSRVDNSYARIFFSYFDENGVEHKRFQLPHENPGFDREMTKNYNYPEFSTYDVPMSPRQLWDLLDKQDVLKVNFKGTYDYSTDANTGASTLKK